MKFEIQNSKFVFFEPFINFMNNVLFYHDSLYNYFIDTTDLFLYVFLEGKI